MTHGHHDPDEPRDSLEALLGQRRRFHRNLINDLETLQGVFNMANRTIKEVIELVRKDTTQEGSLRKYVAELKQRIKDAEGDQAEIDAVFAEVEANIAETAKAMAENVPVPEPNPSPPGRVAGGPQDPHQAGGSTQPEAIQRAKAAQEEARRRAAEGR